MDIRGLSRVYNAVRFFRARQIAHELIHALRASQTGQDAAGRGAGDQRSLAAET